MKKAKVQSPAGPKRGALFAKWMRRRIKEAFRYPLFEHMSREHGLTLLDSEMDDIRNVCRQLEENRAWISVDERLPETDVGVLVYVPNDRKGKDGVWAGYHNGTTWKPISEGWFVDQVTHWREFPEPPKKDKPRRNTNANTGQRFYRSKRR